MKIKGNISINEIWLLERLEGIEKAIYKKHARLNILWLIGAAFTLGYTWPFPEVVDAWEAILTGVLYYLLWPVILGHALGNS